MIEVGDKLTLFEKEAKKYLIPATGWIVTRVIKNNDGTMEYVVKNGEIFRQVPHKFVKGIN